MKNSYCITGLRGNLVEGTPKPVLNIGTLICCLVFSAVVVDVHAFPGEELWDNSYGDSVGGDTNDGVSAVAQDSTGNVYAAGYEKVGGGTGGNGYDAHAVKYDMVGNQVNSAWPLIYDSAISYSADQFVGAAVDGGDNLILVGKGQKPNWDVCQEITIGKYNSAGSEQWAHAYGSGSPPPGDPQPSWWDC